MSSVLAPPANAPPISFPLAYLNRLRRFTPAEYYRLLSAGVLYEGEPVELLEGFIVEKGMRGPLHDAAVQRMTVRLLRKLPLGWTLRVQSAISTGESEPEPDGAVVRGDETSYDARHPVPSEIGIIIEVSDSSLTEDRRERSRIYARADIPVYWVLNLVDRRIEVYSDPHPTADPPSYGQQATFVPGQVVSLTLDGSSVGTISASDLLP